MLEVGHYDRLGGVEILPRPCGRTYPGPHSNSSLVPPPRPTPDYSPSINPVPLVVELPRQFSTEDVLRTNRWQGDGFDGRRNTPVVEDTRYAENSVGRGRNTAG